MSASDKIVIGSTIVIATSAVTMLAISKKYEKATTALTGDLQDIQYLLSRSREDIIAGNKAIVEGNRILRELVKNSAEDISNQR